MAGSGQRDLAAVDNLRERQRPADQEALGFVAAFVRKQRELVGRLDAFRQNGNLQALTQRKHLADDGAVDRACLGVGLGHEQLVELDLVEREGAQRVER